MKKSRKGSAYHPIWKRYPQLYLDTFYIDNLPKERLPEPVFTKAWTFRSIHNVMHNQNKRQR